MQVEGTSAWFPILTEPHREFSAVSGLIGRQFKAYCPTYHVRVRHGRQALRVVDRPVFNGYAFVWLHRADNRFNRVRAVPGVREFFKLNGEYRPLRAWEMDLIERIQHFLDGQFHESERSKGTSDFQIGQMVQVAGGVFPLLGYLLRGKVERIDKNGQIRLSIPELGRMSSVTVNASQIVAA